MKVQVDPYAWIKEYKEFGITINTLNKLYSSWKRINSDFGNKPPIVIQVGKKEFEYMKTWGWTGMRSGKYENDYEEILEIFNAKLQVMDKENYLWMVAR